MKESVSTFVANKLAKIHKQTKPEQWNSNRNKIHKQTKLVPR